MKYYLIGKSETSQFDSFLARPWPEQLTSDLDSIDESESSIVDQSKLSKQRDLT